MEYFPEFFFHNFFYSHFADPYLSKSIEALKKRFIFHCRFLVDLTAVFYFWYYIKVFWFEYRLKVILTF